jgi:glycosyltransferase involved in cell wall biosynthesis
VLEFVVVDTPSVDRTREIAREFGAKVFDFVWIDDFAAARNEALAHATGDYAFWLDADDVIEPAEREKLVRLLQKLTRGDEAGYVVRCACDPGADEATGATVVDHAEAARLWGEVLAECPGDRQALESLEPLIKRLAPP